MDQITTRRAEQYITGDCSSLLCSQLQTRDGCAVVVECAVYYRIEEARRAAIATDDPDESARRSCAPVCRNVLSGARVVDIVGRSDSLVRSLMVRRSIALFLSLALYFSRKCALNSSGPMT